ncbi:hypothetical protein ES708_20493 [subsurface metagenome]
MDIPVRPSCNKSPFLINSFIYFSKFKNTMFEDPWIKTLAIDMSPSPGITLRITESCCIFYCKEYRGICCAYGIKRIPGIYIMISI